VVPFLACQEGFADLRETIESHRETVLPYTSILATLTHSSGPTASGDEVSEADLTDSVGWSLSTQRRTVTTGDISSLTQRTPENDMSMRLKSAGVPAPRSPTDLHRALDHRGLMVNSLRYYG
jgi:hypothetical protein